MLAVVWVLAATAVVLALLQLGVALRLGTRMTPVGPHGGGEPEGDAANGAASVDTSASLASDPRPPLSALVPLKGAPVGLEDRLRRLLDALRDEDQLVLALETEGDPAYEVASGLRATYGERDVAVVLSGPAGERMGKQHNLNATLTRARHDLVAFMDDDVLIERANFDEAAAVVSRTSRGVGVGEAVDTQSVGSAFALPFYGLSATPRSYVGGDLVAAYTNHGFSPNMASLALQSPPRFIIGGFWMTSQDSLEAIGGLEQFTATVSDDAAIGRAFHEAGLRNVLLRRPVRLEPERLNLSGGLSHVLKWLTLLRAEGLGVLLICFLTWNPLATGLLAGLLALAAPEVSSLAGPALLGALIVLRVVAIVTLDARVYGLQPVGRYLPMQLLYEALMAPWLFLVAAFRREVKWRGRRYRLGAGGRVIQPR